MLLAVLPALRLQCCCPAACVVAALLLPCCLRTHFSRARVRGPLALEAHASLSAHGRPLQDLSHRPHPHFLPPPAVYMSNTEVTACVIRNLSQGQARRQAA